nr:unnamed protein product [Callosobruchus analis]
MEQSKNQQFNLQWNQRRVAF